MASSLKDSHVLQLLPALALALTLSALAVPLRFLRGLRCYWAAAGASAQVAGRGKKVRTRRGAAGKKDDDVDLGGAEALIVAPLGLRDAGQLLYQGAFENLVRLLTGWKLACCCCFVRACLARLLLLLCGACLAGERCPAACAMHPCRPCMPPTLCAPRRCWPACLRCA